MRKDDAMRKRAIILIVLITAFLIAACTPPEKLNIRDFDDFKNLPAGASKLVVDYEDDLTGEFEITDEAAVKEVMDILLSQTYVRRAKSGELNGGNNGTLSVIVNNSDGEEYRISLNALNKGGYAYTSETNALIAKLRETGLEYGALKVR